jgi:membrane protein GlpM
MGPARREDERRAPISATERDGGMPVSWREAAVRFVVGGGLVLFVSFLGKTRYPYVAGLAVLFPIVTFVGYYFLSAQMHGRGLQGVVLYGIFSVPALVAYLLVVYFTIDRLPAWQSLLLGLAAWVAVALPVVAVGRLLLGLGGAERWHQ